MIVIRKVNIKKLKVNTGVKVKAESRNQESDRQGGFFHSALAWSPGQHRP